jgi:hypothetical protein
LSTISQLQRSIVNMQQHIKLRADALKQQREDFVHLEIVHRLPDVYACFLAEVKRRKASEAVFSQCLSKSGDKLRRLYDDEVAAREAFLVAHGQMLPPDFAGTFLPSLFQKPPKFRLERAGIPPDLPDLDLPFEGASLASAAAGTGATIVPRRGAAATATTLPAVTASVRATAAAASAATTAESDKLQRGSLIFPAPEEGDESSADYEVLQLRHRVAQLELEVARLQGKERAKGTAGRMLSYLCFNPGDMVLFLPVLPTTRQHDVADLEDRRHYLAFNQGCPRYYLNDLSLQFHREKNDNKYPAFIVGEIIVIDQLLAGSRGDHERNPYDLREGTAFHVVTIESRR